MKFNSIYDLKAALVYDKVNTFGGAERVLLALHELFFQAPLYTSVYDEGRAGWAKVFPEVVPSFLQKFPLARAHPQWYTPLVPLAVESLNLNDYELIISVTSGEAKGVITKPEAAHLCYCLTPTRYLWVDPGYEDYDHFGWLNPVVKVVKGPLLSRLRVWDQAAAARPEAYATISETVARRIKKYYRREAEVIYPPVDTEVFRPGEQTLREQNSIRKVKQDSAPGASEKIRNQRTPYFLLVARLVPYKKVGLAIEAFQELGLPLKIVGSGPDYHRLWSMINHGPTGGTRTGAYPQNNIPVAIELLGKVDEGQLVKLYQNCQALIIPQEEDWGLVALEAMACGKPVIAYGKGGARETVIKGKTGLLFEEQTTESLVKAVRRFRTRKFDSRVCRQQALKFSLDKFQVQMRKWVASQARSIKKEV